MTGLRPAVAIALAASLAAGAAPTAVTGSHAPAAASNQRAAQHENLNCNDPGVAKGAGAWQPEKSQLQSLDEELAKVFRFVAAKAGVPKTHYGLLHCGIHEGDTQVIVVNGVRRSGKTYVCFDLTNFAVAFDPAKKTFGTFHFAANLCRPPEASKPK